MIRLPSVLFSKRFYNNAYGTFFFRTIKGLIMTVARGNIVIKLSEAAALSGRNKNDITLIAVSKQQPDERIEESLASGQRVFGENRVQEAFERWQARKIEYPEMQLHLIGPLQSNKAQNAVALFDVIHTVDRPKIAKALEHQMTAAGRSLSCFIQVNTGEEDQKAGIAPDKLESFLSFCRDEVGLQIVGLMCIPPVDEEPAMHFALLKKLADRYELSQISMGMSSDFDTAISFGATHIRVGAAFFGERPPRA
jgi:PLP dependent protein